MSFAKKTFCGAEVTVTGTPEYRAPEVCNNWGYSAKVDIWGLGLTAFAMIAGVLRAAARPVFSYKPLHLATKVSPSLFSFGVKLSVT